MPGSAAAPGQMTGGARSGMTRPMSPADVIAQIPYFAAHGLEVLEASEAGGRVRLPPADQFLYRFGMVHAGAVFTACQAAAHLAAWAAVAQDEAVFLVRGVTARYTRRATGEVVATAVVLPAHVHSARLGFEQNGRADMMVEVTATDGEGTKVAEGSVQFALRRMPTTGTPPA